MKIFVKTLMIMAGLLFSTLTYAADAYTFDPMHTYVLWQASHFGFSNQSGKWPATGTLILDDKNPENSKVNVTIQMTSLATGLPEFDKHLKGKLFLDVEQYPTATFVSNKVTKTSDKTADVQGTLTLHGVAKPVTLKVTLNKKGINLLNDKETIGFSGTTAIKRSDFNITTLLPEIGDQVSINIQAEAYKAKS